MIRYILIPIKTIGIVLLMIMMVVSCEEETNRKVDISNIEVLTEIVRFDQLFYTTPIEELGKLKAEFPYLFPEPNHDSIWINKMQDKDEQALFEESQKLYKYFDDEVYSLTSLFGHIKYYYPKFEEPSVVTILTNVDYNSNVVLADSLLFISLDIFLGKDNSVYNDFPNYIKQNYTKEHLIVAVADKFSDQIIPISRINNLVSKMVQEGKKLALTERFLPEVDRAEIMGYTPEQYGWAENSEIDIWKYFLQNEMLYDSDTQLVNRFIDDAPFSKFFLEADRDSPGRIGAWFGWRIVNSYLKHNDVSIQQMMLMDNEELFKQSKYKPKK